MSPGMLRARRRDANLKPNRVLDKGSSRGMIYENEELRLRTINITSEIERGQTELKKLKRENDHLRREIWALRDEVDRLEALLKQKEQEEEASSSCGEEEEGGRDAEDEDQPTAEQPHPTKPAVRVPRVTIEPDGLSVVPEESEDGSTPEPQSPNAQCCSNTERQVEEYRGVLPPCIRLNCVHPYTTATTIKGTPLADVTAVEVIESVGRSARGLVGVRLLEDSLYLSWRGRAELEAAVAASGRCGGGLCVRGVRLQLTDVSQGTVVLAMSAIPHNVTEPTLVRLISQFGPVIGGIERRIYRGTDTGEGLVRIRPQAALPKRLYLDGAEINVRPYSHEELAKLVIDSSHSRPRPSIGLIIRTDKDDGRPAENHVKNQPSCGSTFKNEPFVFPPVPSSSSLSSTGRVEEQPRSQSAPIRTPEHGSTSSLRPHSDTETATGTSMKKKKGRRGKSPSSGEESPAALRPARRRPSLVPHIIDRERSNSLSSRASYSRRKMSLTGRETGKMPWCACWGNGCY